MELVAFHVFIDTSLSREEMPIFFMTEMFLWLLFGYPCRYFHVSLIFMVNYSEDCNQALFYFMQQRLSTQLAKDMVLQNYYA
jgi:hypothetical protein